MTQARQTQRRSNGWIQSFCNSRFAVIPEECVGQARSDTLITQSLIDRLTDLDQWPETRSASIGMYRESLKRDVEWLLNTRQPVIPELESFPATAASVLNYGLPDFHNLKVRQAKNRML